VAACCGATAPRWIGPIQALLVQQKAVMAASSASRSPDGRQRHILAVNNDQMILGLLRDLLADAGYRVTTQTYLDKDFDALTVAAPDLIILDYMWPDDDNGWAYLQLLRMDGRGAAIPVVLCIARCAKSTSWPAISPRWGSGLCANPSISTGCST
jgi:CheY-like chemotaxis protein